MIRLNQIKLAYNHTNEQLLNKVANTLKINRSDVIDYEIIRRSIDARKKPDIFYTYSLNVTVRNEKQVLNKLIKNKNNDEVQLVTDEEYVFPISGKVKMSHRPVVIGTGPAGLFCAYFLALHGYKPIVFERGFDVDKRTLAVDEFWKTGKLNEISNVQFGEGGAGTFSDGKLNTLVKDKSKRNKEVLKTFIKFGADKEILYDSKPHIGTDVLKNVVKNIRNAIIDLGGEVHFESKLTGIEMDGNRINSITVNETHKIPCDNVVLALGHSARDTITMLYNNDITMESKAFAVGFRVLHEQSFIDFSQYGMTDVSILGAAPYKVTAKTGFDRGVYSFCMCPGGYVVNASSEPKRLAINGMSYSGRDGKYANSAIIVSVTPDDYNSDSPLAGIEFQRKIEEKAYELGNGKIPVQYYGDFVARVNKSSLPDNFDYHKSLSDGIKGQYTFADLTGILPEECNKAFIEGMASFGRQIKGFDNNDTMMMGVESRTSSPIRIIRDDGLEASIKGIYPCGEGAGYAGGITSAAMDGLKVAETIASKYAPFE